MTTKADLFSRLESLKAAHPDMIFDWHTVIGYFSPDRVFLRCVCPEYYDYWDYNADTPHCQLTSKHVIEDGVYTLLGAVRKVAALERLDWSRFDLVARNARRQRREILKRIDSFFKAACSPCAL